MSPEYRENQKHKRYGPGRLLRLIASAAVLLVCVCLSTSHSYAWTEIPDSLLRQQISDGEFSPRFQHACGSGGETVPDGTVFRAVRFFRKLP